MEILIEDGRGGTAKEQNREGPNRQRGKPTVRAAESLEGTVVKGSAVLKACQRATARLN